MNTDVLTGPEQKLAVGERTSGTYETLREWIVSGRLAAGSEISQLELTRLLGVSRTPLREALRLLTKDGLVQETDAHRQVKISSLSLPELDEVYSMRVSVAVLALWHTVPKLTISDLGLLRQDLAIIEAGGPDAREAHRRFHAGFAKHAGNRIQETLATLTLHAERYQSAYATTTKNGRRMKHAEHVALIQACEMGDSELVRDLMIDHMAGTAFGLMKKFNYTPVLLPTAVKLASCPPR